MRLMLLFYLGSLSLCAQTLLNLSGRVLDPSGATVAEARIELRGVGGTIAVTSGARGEFTLAARPGTYRISVVAAGFERLERDIELREDRTFDLTLAILKPMQQVTVTAKAPPGEGVVEAETSNWREHLEVREIRESAAKDVGEALTRLDGLSKIRKGGIANDIVLRGFQQDNLNVLIDGARIYGACPNNMDPPGFHVDFAEVESVQVTKGAFDVRNQGSLGGAIEIVSKHPEQGLSFKPGLAAGSFGYVNPSLAGSVAKGRFDATAGYSFRRSMPYQDGSGHRFTDYANYQQGMGDHEAFSIGTGWVRLGFAPRPTHRAQLSYTRQNGGEVLYPYLQMDALYDNADRLGANYSTPWLRAESYFTRVNHWMTDEHRTSSIGAPRPYGMATFAATKALGGRVEVERSGLVAGVEAYRRNWDTVTTMRMAGQYMDQSSIPDVTSQVAGVYAQYRKAIVPALLLTAGARLDTASMEANASQLNRDLYWAYHSTGAERRRDTNPSANAMLGWKLAPGWELFAGAGHTTRIPDPQERFIAFKRMGTDWVGDPSLRPTRNTEVDLGVNYRAGRVTFRPTVFFSRLDDFIVLATSPKLNMLPSVMNPSARSYANVDASMRGGELTWSVMVSRSLLVSGGASYTRGFTRQGRNLAEMPPFQARAAVRYGGKRFFAEMESLAAWRQDRVDTALNEQPTPGFGIWNARTGIHTKRVNLTAGVENLLDRFYYEHFSYQRDPFRIGTRVPEPGRSLFVNAWWQF